MVLSLNVSTVHCANYHSPWKMYPLGILFGLGFDTSSEIALLGISSVEAARGTDFWVILIFPILFTGTSSVIRSTLLQEKLTV